MADQPPFDPDTHKMTFASIGLPDEAAVKAAIRKYKKLTAEISALPKRPKPTYQQVRDIIDRYPPEVKALLLMRLMSDLSNVLKAWRDWTNLLVTVVPEEDEASIRQTIADAFERAFLPIRKAGRGIVADTVQRAAEGFPAWSGAVQPAPTPPINDMQRGVEDYLAQLLAQGGLDDGE